MHGEHLCRRPPECTIGYCSIRTEARSTRGREMTAKPRIASPIAHSAVIGCSAPLGWRRSFCRLFSEGVGEVALKPATGGASQIEVGAEIIWECKCDGGFPDVRTLKQRVRDHLAAGRDLGHVDR
jgi:selenoprotein W-related protein